MPTAPAHVCPTCHKATKGKCCAKPSPYDAEWRKARALFLQDHPCCIICEEEGVVELAVCVDHIMAWSTGSTEEEQLELFWDSDDNWQSMCIKHHNAKSGRGE